MSIINYIKRPEYFLQPGALIRRILRGTASSSQKTSWGSSLNLNPHETIGKAITITGIYDLAVSETLWRLIEPGDFVLDIGANIGYTSTLASHRAKTKGKVWAFEPNPKLRERLTANLQLSKYQNYRIFHLALSNANGKGSLVLPEFYANNEGIAYIGTSNTGSHVTVDLRRLDDILPKGDTTIDVLKIDVEGHELSVFEGSQNALDQKAIKNIVYEDHSQYPSDLAHLLLSKGYKIYRIEKGWLNVLLKDPKSTTGISSWEPTNYLATLNPEKVSEKMKGLGYRCLFD